ncbi:MAG TPA: MFS transporter [Candidatus Saccharimonadales bacterium]|nr:MFS transporter [Candidatus Saccharimonadales bacterium]
MTRRQTLILLATILGSGIVILDGTVVNLALPKIAHNLHASFADLQWIADSFLLSLSALILVGGSLGDIFGRKKLYLIGIIGFGISSLLCGLAPNTAFLISARLLQGIFGALLVPGALAIINTNFPAKLRGAAIGSWSAWIAIFAPLGPILGGYLLDVTSWRWIFLINPPFVALCAVLAWSNFEESRDQNPRRVDVPGSLLAIGALTGITYGLIEGPTNHWHVSSLVPLLAGVICSIAFLYVEKRVKDPIVPLGLFTSRNFSGSNLMTFMMYGALGGFLFAFVIYLQNALHYSSIKAGVSVLPLPIALFLLSKRFGALSARLGPRIFMTLGPLFTAAGILSMYKLHATNSYLWHILPGMLLFGFGMSLLVAPLTVTVMASVNETSSGIASGINNAVARVSGLFVVAILGLFGTHSYYKFAIILCGAMAIASGVISYAIIVNPKSKKSLAK